MKRLILVGLTALTVLFTSPSFSDDITDAKIAILNEDYATAFRLLTPLAEQGHSYSLNVIAYMYDEGWGVPQNHDMAMKWYKFGADRGDASSQYNLGIKYGSGRGVQKDNKAEFEWYKLAAEQGLAIAQYSLGLKYESASGVLQDYIKAHMWHNIAASRGDTHSITRLNSLAKKMTPKQIELAQKLARECVKKAFKNC